MWQFLLEGKAKHKSGKWNPWSESRKIEIWFYWTYGGSYSDWASSVIETSDSAYLLAGCTSSFGAVGYDMYLVKIRKK